MKVKDFARKYDFALPLYLKGRLVDRELRLAECWRIGDRVNKWKFNPDFKDAEWLITSIKASADAITLELK